MRRLQYLAIMTTIVLVIVLLGISFAWYSAGNSSVSANNLTVTAAQPNETTLKFEYANGDMEDKLYIAESHQVADSYGRLRYTGETGIEMDEDEVTVTGTSNIASYTTTTGDTTTTHHNYRFMLYYLIDLSSTTELTATFEISGCTIYKVRNWTTFTIDQAEYTLTDTAHADGGKVVTDKDDTEAGRYVEGGETDSYEGQFITTGGTSCYFIGGIVYGLSSGDLVVDGKYSSNLSEVGYYGERVQVESTAYNSNFTIYAWNSDSYTIVQDKLSSEPTPTAPESDQAKVEVANTGTTQVLLGIKYEKADDKFAYSDESFMGAYFNFDITVTTDETA